LVLRGAITERNTRSAALCSRKTALCGYGTSILLVIVERRNLHLPPIGLATELIAVVWDFFRVTSLKTGKYTMGALRKWSTFTKDLRVPQRSTRMSEILAAVRQSLLTLIAPGRGNPTVRGIQRMTQRTTQRMAVTYNDFSRERQ
jgi:hypothetical protein